MNIWHPNITESSVPGWSDGLRSHVLAASLNLFKRYWENQGENGGIYCFYFETTFQLDLGFLVVRFRFLPLRKSFQNHSTSVSKYIAESCGPWVYVSMSSPIQLHSWAPLILIYFPRHWFQLSQKNTISRINNSAEWWGIESGILKLPYHW
jgi:hypothetical protein